MHPELSEAKRFPLLTDSGQKLLHRLKEDPHAPRWNWPVGEQLDESGLSQVQAFARALEQPRRFAGAQHPPWLGQLVDFCLEEVPFYRRRSAPGTPFAAIPSCSRDDLAPNVWDFVPDRCTLDQLIVFSSSGTTGHPARMPSHPATAASGVPLLESALASESVRLPRGPESMAIINVAAFRGAYTTPIVISYLRESGYARVNLLADDWRLPGDEQLFLDRWHPTVYLGDPLALETLRQTRIAEAPQAIVSSIATLQPSFAEQLRRHFGCPVLDVYAMTEVGLLALRTDDGYKLLPHDVYVEILDEHDEPCPPGCRGEIALTGGRNPFAPLLRYRTGDFASLQWCNGEPLLCELEGRPPVVFPVADAREVHSMEVSLALRELPLVQYQLHQDADGGFAFRYRGDVTAEVLRERLFDLLGRPRRFEISTLPSFAASQKKMLAFASDLRPTSQSSK